MTPSAYKTEPTPTEGMPKGVPYILANEVAERFSYYGMNSILVLFMTQHMKTASGAPDVLTKEQANVWYHSFVVALYVLPVLGAFLADAVLGKYRTILYLSIVYCFGHLALAIDDTRTGLVIGLALIALGAGGIKPCVSANVGDQFGPSNQHLLTKVFAWFYFSINLGSAFATMMIDPILKRFGPSWAFGLPGILMLIATIVFWAGRKKYVHVPPGGVGFLKTLVSREGLGAVGRLLILVPFAGMFWAVWQQNFSSWVTQAIRMDRNIFGWEILEGQVQTANAVLILVFLPLFSYVVYPTINRVFPLTPLRKLGLGMWITAFSFLIPAWIETQLDAGLKPSIGWQLLAYVFLTAGEIMVSVTHLEFCYTQAPKSMKSVVMATYLGAISAGNAFTALVNWFIQKPDGTVMLSGASYFLFFAATMAAVALIFIPVAMFYKGRTYLQQEEPGQANS